MCTINKEEKITQKENENEDTQTGENGTSGK